MSTSEIAILISLIGLFISFWSIRKTIRYSQINLINNIQQFSLHKAQDCNLLWEKYGASLINQTTAIGMDHVIMEPIGVLHEMNISYTLIKNSINSFDNKGLREKQTFFLIQFWTQINPTLRQYIKASLGKSPTNHNEKELFAELEAIKRNFPTNL